MIRRTFLVIVLLGLSDYSFGQIQFNRDTAGYKIENGLDTIYYLCEKWNLAIISTPDTIVMYREISASCRAFIWFEEIGTIDLRSYATRNLGERTEAFAKFDQENDGLIIHEWEGFPIPYVGRYSVLKRTENEFVLIRKK